MDHETKALQLKNVRHDFETLAGEIGVTVRRGFKWAAVPMSTQVELWRCDAPHYGVCPEIGQGGEYCCKQQGTGLITGHWVGQFKDLPARVIEREHEAESRNYSGLLFSMRRAYGQQFAEGEYVTALFYVRQR